MGVKLVDWFRNQVTSLTSGSGSLSEDKREDIAEIIYPRSMGGGLIVVKWHFSYWKRNKKEENYHAKVSGRMGRANHLQAPS